jgi:hypothetical protein
MYMTNTKFPYCLFSIEIQKILNYNYICTKSFKIWQISILNKKIGGNLT